MPESTCSSTAVQYTPCAAIHSKVEPDISELPFPTFNLNALNFLRKTWMPALNRCLYGKYVNFTSNHSS